MSLRRSEDGFTVVEAVIASMLLGLAALAVLATFDGAQRATFRAEQRQVASDIAQREIEALRSKPYSQLALTTTPAAVSSPTDPRSRIAAGNFRVEKDDPGSASAMVVNGGTLTGGGTVSGGTVAPSCTFGSGANTCGSTGDISGDISGSVHRFVVWRNDPNCLNLLCGGTQDYKRAIVAVVLNASGSGGEQSYIEIQSDMIDPDASVAGNVNLPLLGTPTVAQQFWLSDERCQPTGEPTHSATLGSHAVRNTFGDFCTGTTRPDALLTTPPNSDDPPNSTASSNGTNDYATDADLEPIPASADAGLQLHVPPSNGCQLYPAGTNGYKAQHIWVSKRLNGTGAYALTGGATLNLWTRTINDVPASARLCVVLFRRLELALSPLLTGNANVTLATATPTISSWPADGWEEVKVQMTFPPDALPLVTGANLLHQRIGIAVGFERAGTPLAQGQLGPDVMFNFDHPNFESRLEVETTTPIG